MLVRRWRPPWPVDLRRTLSSHHRGRGDPTHRVDADGTVWRTCRTPDGPATMRLVERPSEALVEATSWGAGASWMLDMLPGLLGENDDASGFQPVHAALREVSQRLSGFRVGGTGRVMEALIPAVLEQKVTTAEAHRGWRSLMAWYGERAPGPRDGLRVFPASETWRRIPSWDWHRAGVEAVRGRTIIAACQVANRLEETLTMPSNEADRRLRVVPGIGVWTAAEVRQRAHGDPDAVSVGDYHLPSVVGWVLAGKEKNVMDDAGMLELLTPYAGHRYRVTRLLELGGMHPPRRGPRLASRDYRSI